MIRRAPGPYKYGGSEKSIMAHQLYGYLGIETHVSTVIFYIGVWE